MIFLLRTAVLAVLAFSSVSSQHLRAPKNQAFQSRRLQVGCDEEPDTKDTPRKAMLDYQAINTFPVVPIGQCGDPEDGYEVDGMPASPARPMLFKNCMFGTNSGACTKNFNDHDLPIVDTYYDDAGRPVDVYETISTANPTAVDLFKIEVPSGQINDDSCRPTDYIGTNGFFLYGSPSVPHYFPAPTVKNCLGRQGVVRFVNSASRAPISVHLHGAASAVSIIFVICLVPSVCIICFNID
jgi:hypothetical protein